MRNLYILLSHAPALTTTKKRKQIPGGEDGAEETEMSSWCGQIENGTARPTARAESSQKRRKRQRTEGIITVSISPCKSATMLMLNPVTNVWGH